MSQSLDDEVLIQLLHSFTDWSRRTLLLVIILEGGEGADLADLAGFTLIHPDRTEFERHVRFL